MRKRIIWLLAFLIGMGMLVIAGLSPMLMSRGGIRRTAQPAVIVEDLAGMPPQIDQMWQVEVGRRFNHAIVVIVHGNDFVAGDWIVGASLTPWKHIMRAQDVVREYQRLYPDRTMVFVSCNPDHLKLGIPGVYYANSSVWVIPDRDVMDEGVMWIDKWSTLDHSLIPVLGQSRWQADPDVAGNIWEFITD